MNIEEIRSHREHLELKIFTLLNDFKTQTGMSIVGCDIRCVSSQRISAPSPEIVLASVSLNVESI